MSTQLIKLDQVVPKYLDKSFNLTIKEGDIIVVSGPNGTGKTTLVKLLLGLIFPKSGKITSSTKLNYSYMPEQIELPPFIKTFTYLEIIAKLKKSKIDQELLTEFLIPLDKDINHLSKGNKQKLGLVTALMGNPHIICLDEPLSGLDSYSQNILIKKIKEKQKQGVSFVISTHKKELFLPYSTQAVTLC